MNNTFDLVCIYSLADTSQPFFSPSIFAIQMKKYLLTGFLSKFMRTSVICGRDAHRQSDEGFFKCVFNVLVLMKEYWYSPSYTVLLSFFPQPISIITVLECQHESACYLKGALQGSHTSSLNTWCLEQGVRQSHGRCLLPPQKKKKAPWFLSPYHLGHAEIKRGSCFIRWYTPKSQAK